MKLFVSHAIVFVVLWMAACSHGQAPIAPLNETELETYLRAKKEEFTEISQNKSPTSSCPIYLKLSQSSQFVLRDVAYLHALISCDTASLKTSPAHTLPDWLKKEERIAQLKHQDSDVTKALFIIETPQYFPSKDRIAAYQAALDPKASADETSKKKIAEALYSIAPRLNPHPKDEDIFKITKDLRSIRDFNGAREKLLSVVNNKKQSTENKMAALKEIYMTYKVQRHLKKNYLESAYNWAHFLKPKTRDFKKHQDLYLEAQVAWIRTIWTEQGVETAFPLVGLLETDLKGKVSIHEVYWLKGRMLEEQKLWDESAHEYEKAQKERGASVKDQEKYIWSLGWLQLRQKKFLDAKNKFQQAAALKDISPFSQWKYLFWSAESARGAGQSNDAQTIYQNVASQDPFGYYGLVSMYRLNQVLPSLNPSLPPETFSLLQADQLQLFNYLLRADEWILAAQFLKSTFISSHRMQDLNDQQNVELFTLVEKTKNYKLAFELFGQLPFEAQRKVLQQSPQLLFPQPFSQESLAAHQETGVEVELIYAIMRQESSFDPAARSPMDAIGLLQVLPEVAARVSPVHNIPYKNFTDLQVPATNILIGAYLLKNQMKSFDNRFPLYVASYNASDSAIKQWQKRYLGLDPLEFIESIPYEETKGYVKLVLRNYLIYKKIKMGNEFQKIPDQLLTF